MIKIGVLELDVPVYVSSPATTANFAVAGFELEADIENAFKTAEYVEFNQGHEVVRLYSAVLRDIHRNYLTGMMTVLFSGAELPENKSKALERRARELEAKNEELTAKNEELEEKLNYANDTVGILEEAVAELAELVGGEEA